MAVSHVKSNTIADFTGTVTVYDAAGSTATAAATDLVRPSDWNSAHYQAYSLSGNTAGTSVVSGTDIVWQGGNNITLSGTGSTIQIVGGGGGGFAAGASTDAAGTTGLATNQIVFFEGNNISLSQSVNGGSASITIADNNAAGASPLFLTYQNRQLGASSQQPNGNNSQLWITPFRVAGGSVSASTLLIGRTFTGTSSSGVAQSYGETLRVGLYSNNTTNSTRVDTFWTTSFTMGVSGNGSTGAQGVSFQGGSTTSASTALIGSYVYGARLYTVAVNSTIPTGLYALAYHLSTTTSGYANFMATRGIVVDAPMSTYGLGYVGATTATTLGFVDAGTYSASTGALPASIGLADIRQSNNVVPWFKMGAL